MSTELERTFLAKALPPSLSASPHKRLVDCYIPSSKSSGHPRLRLRREDDDYTLTKKIPLSDSDASIHEETTLKLSESEFQCLKSCTDLVVEKDRYCIKLGQANAEVDVFRGALTGLVLIEFEFDNKEDLAAFIPPDVCLADVTQEDFIAGGLLAGKSYQMIASDLNRFNYAKITT